MNSFLFSTFTLCLVAQAALAQYGAGSSYGQQRKMAPSPQVYGNHASQYGNEMSTYEQPSSYRAPSSAAVSQYDERVPTNGYSKPAPMASYNKPVSSGYGQQAASYGQQTAGYGQQAVSYAKPAPKYEEPYYPPMPFAWGYDINDGYGGAQYHKENGDEYGKRTGSYGYTDAYGIYRQVDYVADENGFRATIKTNEPGTANESPADVEMHAYEPPSNYYAGNQGSSYSAAPASSYGSVSNSHSSSSSYSTPASVSTYQAARPMMSYAPQPSGYVSKAPKYEQSQYGSGSAVVPVYQAAGSRARRY